MSRPLSSRKWKVPPFPVCKRRVTRPYHVRLPSGFASASILRVSRPVRTSSTSIYVFVSSSPLQPIPTMSLVQRKRTSAWFVYVAHVRNDVVCGRRRTPPIVFRANNTTTSAPPRLRDTSFAIACSIHDVSSWSRPRVRPLLSSANDPTPTSTCVLHLPSIIHSHKVVRRSIEDPLLFATSFVVVGGPSCRYQSTNLHSLDIKWKGSTFIQRALIHRAWRCWKTQKPSGGERRWKHTITAHLTMPVGKVLSDAIVRESPSESRSRIARCVHEAKMESASVGLGRRRQVVTHQMQ